MNPIAAAVLLVITIICGILSAICGAAIRFFIYIFQNKHSFEWHDDASKLTGVITAFLFALFFVTFIFKPYRVVEEKQNIH